MDCIRFSQFPIKKYSFVYLNTKNKTLEEGIGYLIFCLFKESKNVIDYEGFSEITSGECNEKHKHYSIWGF